MKITLIDRIKAKVLRPKHSWKNGNVLLYKNTGFLDCKFVFEGCNNIVECSQSYFKGCTFYIRGSNNVVRISSDCFFNSVDFCIEDSDNNISISSGTRFEGRASIACCEGTKISIGQNCLFSSDIKIRTTDSHSIINYNGNRINNAKDIVIGNNVWVGQNCTFLKGSFVCDDSVVGYGSVLTKVFSEKNVIIAGVPAKIVKRNIIWRKER